MEVTVADRCTDNDAVVLHNSLMADNLCRQCLHHHNRVGSHAVSIVEELRHTKYHDVIFFFCKRNVGTLVCHLPGNWLHLFCITAVDLNLTGLGIQYRIAAEKFLAHMLFHLHTNLVKFCSHQGFSADRSKVFAVHNLRNVVGSNGTPVV